MICDFLRQRGRKLEPEKLAEICQAMINLSMSQRDVFDANIFLMGRIALESITALGLKTVTIDDFRKFSRLCRAAPIRSALSSVVSQGGPGEKKRIVDLQREVSDHYALGPIFENFASLDHETRVSAMAFACETMNNAGLNYPKITQNDSLTRLRDEIRTLRSNASISGTVKGQLKGHRHVGWRGRR